MSTFTKLTYHVVISTKYRHPLIQIALQKRLYEYIGGIIRAQNGRLIEIARAANAAKACSHRREPVVLIQSEKLKLTRRNGVMSSSIKRVDLNGRKDMEHLQSAILK